MAKWGHLSFIFLNKSDCYSHLNQPDKALEAYEASIRDYNAMEVLPDDIVICGVSLFHKMGDKEKYNEYVHKALKRIPDMHASEFIDACKVICSCELEDADYVRVEQAIELMESYMMEHPDENRVGLQVEDIKYTYVKQIDDHEWMLSALEKKMYYYDQIVSKMEYQRAESIDEYLDTHRHLQEAVQNEMRANKIKTRFLANMSHDIRTPMNAIVGLETLMEKSVDDPDKIRKYLTKIERSSRYMISLIDDLLDMNKMEHGTVNLNVGVVNLTERTNQRYYLCTDRRKGTGVLRSDKYYPSECADG